MPTTQSAKKRHRQSEKLNLLNASFKSKLRTHRRKLLHAIGDEKRDEAQNLLRSLVSLYDKGVKKGMYKANTAARQKSRLTKRVNALLGPANPATQEGQSLPNPEGGSA